LRENLKFAARQDGRTAEEEEARALGTIPARRLGHPDEFDLAFMCSAHASYLTGQNIVLDGGSSPGLV
jgi:3-oxoacyl-[acyl-carrier protein] reductase